MFFRRALIAAAFSVLGHAHAAAPSYPTRPIRMLAPEPGGGNEIAGRTIAQAISEGLGQNVVVENRGSASGAIAGEIVARATPDGYTLLYYGSTIWLLPFLRKQVPFDTLRDFMPVAQASRAPFYLFAHPSVPAANIKELIAHAKANPGKLNYGSAGSGSATHISAEFFKSLAGVSLTRVAYKGAAVSMNALISGEVHVMFTSASGGLSHVRAGRLKVFGIAARQPAAISPEVPTMAAAGLPGFEVASMSGLFAPIKTPRAIVDVLNNHVARALTRDDVKQRFLNYGIDAVGGTPEEFAAVIRTDIAKWSKVIRDAGIHEDQGR